MLTIIILMFLLCGIKGRKGFQADIYFLSALRLQPSDGFRPEGFLLFGQVVHRQGIGMSAVDELAALVKGIHTGQENFQQLPIGNLLFLIVDADGLTVAGTLIALNGLEQVTRKKGMTGFSFYSFGVALFAFILYLVI